MSGGAGFIGSFVVDTVAEAGHDVLVVDRLHPGAHDGRPPYLRDDVEYRWVDVCDPLAMADAVQGVDAVSHQAAMVGLGVDFADVSNYVRDNDLGTAVLLEALHRSSFVGRLALASSMVVYGEGRYRCNEHGVVCPGPRTALDLDAGRFEPSCPRCGKLLEAESVGEDAPVDPRNVYAATKLQQEHLAAAFAREHPGVAVTSLRYHNVYGPRMPGNTPYAGVASIFRSSLERGEAPQVFEDGGQRRDFVHVADVAAANIAALTVGTPFSGPVNVATGDPHTVLDMATALAGAFGGPSPEVVGGYRLGDVRHVFASADRAREVLGFEATIPFAEGMTEFATAALR